MVAIDVCRIGNGKYVLISENRVSFLSEISDESLLDALKEEEILIREEVARRGQPLPLGSSISFMPTLDCNCFCEYCYSRGGEVKTALKSDVALAAIDHLVSQVPNAGAQTLAIYFVGGGEPFRNFPVVEEICRYARTHFADLDIHVVSNGVFGDRVREWLLKNNVAIRISYDGLAQDEQRPLANGGSSRHIVEKNIHTLTEHRAPLTVQMTVTGRSVEQMTESVSLIAGLGVRFVKIEPVHSSVLSRGDAMLTPDPNRFVEQFLITVRHILESNLDMKIDNSFISRPTSGYYCGAGEGSNTTVTPLGTVTACLEVIRETEPFADRMVVGQCSADGVRIDAERVGWLKRLHWRNYLGCTECNLKLICGGGCPMQGGWDHNDLLTPSSYSCQIHKMLVPRLFAMVFDNPRTVDVLFDNCVVSRGCA